MSSKNIEITKDELWELWLVIEDLSEFLREYIEAGGEGVDDLMERKFKAQKLIQKHRKNKKQ